MVKITKVVKIFSTAIILFASVPSYSQEFSSSSSSGGDFGGSSSGGGSSGGGSSGGEGGGDDMMTNCADVDATFAGRCAVAPSDYVMNILAFRLRRQDGTFLEFPASAASIDFADGAAGSDLGTWISNIEIPAGVYTAVSPIISPIVQIRGESAISGTTNCRTSESGVEQDNGTPTQYSADSLDGRDDLQTGTDTDLGQSSENLDFINGDGNQVVVDPTVTGFPATVIDGTTLTFRFAINPEQGLAFDYDGAGNCTGVSPGPVRVTLSAEVTNP